MTREVRRSSIFTPGIQIAQGFLVDGVGGNVAQAFAGLFDNGAHAGGVEGRLLAVVHRYRYALGARLLFLALFLPRLRALFPVDHVTAGDLVLAHAHQRKFNLVLDVLNMNRASGRHSAIENSADPLGHPFHGLVNPCRTRGLCSLHRQISLRDGYRNLGLVVMYYGAVALDDAQTAGGGADYSRLFGGRDFSGRGFFGQARRFR